MATLVMKSLLDRLGLLSKLRRLRYGGSPPDWVRTLEAETKFYRQFVPVGSLCFDVGANIGSKADCFLSLGARVVCVEPVPGALATLSKKFEGNPSVTIVPKAAGAVEGSAEMQVGDNTTTSTLSPIWKERVASTEGMAGRTWPQSITVPVTTLDALIEEFGLPDFCKIDVEGFEGEVIRGLSVALSALAFEFHSAGLDVAFAVVDRLDSLAGYTYNWSFVSPLRLESPTWLTGTDLKRLLRIVAERNRESYGDVFARRLP